MLLNKIVLKRLKANFFLMELEPKPEPVKDGPAPQHCPDGVLRSCRSRAGIIRIILPYPDLLNARIRICSKIHDVSLELYLEGMLILSDILPARFSANPAK